MGASAGLLQPSSSLQDANRRDEIRKTAKSAFKAWHFGCIATVTGVGAMIAHYNKATWIRSIFAVATSGAIIGFLWLRPVYENGKLKRVGTYAAAVQAMGKVTPIPLECRKGKLYRSSMPGGSYDDESEVLSLWKRFDVTHIACLNPEKEILKKSGKDLLKEYKKRGLTVKTCPIRNYYGTQVLRIQELVDTIDCWLDDGKNVAIHCSAGVGRTGMVIGCLMQSAFGFEVDEAIQYVQKYLKILLKCQKMNNEPVNFNNDG